MEIIKILGQSNPIQLEEIAIYTVPIDKGCVISHLNICNRSNTTDYYSVAVINGFLPESGIPTKSYIEFEKSITGKTSDSKLKGVTLAQGDTIIIKVTSENESGPELSNLSFNLFGSEFDQTYDYDETLPYGYDYGYGYPS